MKVIDALKNRYKIWRDTLFLKRHGCDSWQQYHRLYDPDYNPRATTVNDYYRGYPYVHCFENHSDAVYYIDLGYNGVYVVDAWCRKNTGDKFRLDYLRVTKKSPNEWEIDELGGGDYIFIAFKSERDYIWFLLRWG